MYTCGKHYSVCRMCVMYLIFVLVAHKLNGVAHVFILEASKGGQCVCILSMLCINIVTGIGGP